MVVVGSWVGMNMIGGDVNLDLMIMFVVIFIDF